MERTSLSLSLTSAVDLVETNHTGRDIRYRIRGFGLPADKVMFMRGERDANGDVALGEEISVAAFFAERYKKLQYPSLPCIDGMAGAQKRANWLPMEVASVSRSATDIRHARARRSFPAGTMGAFIEAAGQRATSTCDEKVHHQTRAALRENHEDRRGSEIRNGSVLETAKHQCRFEGNDASSW